MSARSVVYKYAVKLEDEFLVSLPDDAEVLSVQVQHGKPFMWVRLLADATSAVSRRLFRLAGTGHLIEGDWRFVGTFQLPGGELVFHLFEEIPS